MVLHGREKVSSWALLVQKPLAFLPFVGSYTTAQAVYCFFFAKGVNLLCRKTQAQEELSGFYQSLLSPASPQGPAASLRGKRGQAGGDGCSPSASASRGIPGGIKTHDKGQPMLGHWFS